MTFKGIFEAIGSILKAVVLTVFPFHAAAWRASSASVRCILNAPNQAEQDRLAALWRDSLQSQLTTIAITVMPSAIFARRQTQEPLGRLSKQRNSLSLYLAPAANSQLEGLRSLVQQYHALAHIRQRRYATSSGHLPPEQLARRRAEYLQAAFELGA